MQNLFNTLENILSQDERFITNDVQLLRNAVFEAAMKMDEHLLKLLLDNVETRKNFFKEIEVAGNKTLIFDKIGFGWVINNKAFLPDSYTRYKNKIGLVDETGRFISNGEDVELVFPYKDCVLVGGQTKEEQKRSEIFFNKRLAPDEVDRLLAPKVFVNAKRYTKDGVENITSFRKDDNLIIKGNNLLAIKSLLARYEGKVKCICIDPPYNTNNSEFGYNDTFKHSTWLTFMKNRLEISFRLLEKYGTIFVFCDDNEQAYLKVLMDSIFGRERYIQTIIWKNCDNSNNDAKQFSQDHNYILVYSRDIGWESNKLDRTEEQSRHYKNPDHDPRGPWFDGNPVNSPNPRPNLRYIITAPNGNKIMPPDNGWRWKKEELYKRMASGEIRFNESQTGIIRRTYLNEQKGLPPSTLWEICEEPLWINIDDTGHNRQAKYEQKKIFAEKITSNLFKTPKPEKLIKKIFDISTIKGDIVLDFFGGSGTSAAVAHKMGLQYILCEQMNSIELYIVERLKKVINGEHVGISQSVNWQGGGSFVYCELAQLNEKYVEAVQKAKTDAEVMKILQAVLATGFINDKVNPKLIDTNADDYKALSLNEKKQFVMEVLDSNMLYVNYSDIYDKEFNISETDKAFTKSFYGEE